MVKLAFENLRLFKNTDMIWACRKLNYNYVIEKRWSSARESYGFYLSFCNDEGYTSPIMFLRRCSDKESL